MIKYAGKKQSVLRSHRAAKARTVSYILLSLLFCKKRGRVLCVRRSFFVLIFFWRCFPISAKELQINEEIKVKEVRLIGESGEQLGIMPSEKALNLAYDRGFDLVMMSSQSTPPVCKIMDYGKYRFECEKREKEAKKKQQTVELKEIQLSYRIDTHDFETKVRHAQRFLSDGNKVRVVLKFKGREMSHLAMGKEIMMKFLEACAEMGGADKPPVLDGRFMSMVIAPVKKK